MPNRRKHMTPEELAYDDALMARLMGGPREPWVQAHIVFYGKHPDHMHEAAPVAPAVPAAPINEER